MRASKPKTMQDAIEVATKLRNKKISTLAECQTENKKRLDNTSKNNQNQQQPNKRQNTGRAYTARHGEKKHYSGAKPLCSKCDYHHDGPCAPKCHKCNRFGHLARDCVIDALAARDTDRSQNGEDSHDSGTGVRRQAPPARECTYQDFMKCKLLYFKGTKGVTNLKKKITNKYYLRGEIKKLKVESWNLKVKGTDVSDKIERYISGLLDMIYRSVMTSKPKTMHHTIKFIIELMDKKISTFAERHAENKRKFNDTSKNNQNQQQNKKQNTGRAYTAGSGDKKPYGGSKTLCSKYNYHHDGQCAPKCHKYNRGHFKKECPKLKNNDRGNQDGNDNAPVKVYAKYMLKGCYVFLAHVATKETEDKSEKKQLEDVPIVQDFPEVFPEEFPSLPPTQQVEFQIDLIPGATHGHLIDWPRPK
uniref:Putative reverse transcriptase domain-containing protein n=1 Tax=Tanacetum cinerariifolium TaxID=118510 RepID=A0A699J0W0_TANCI|nr:putative reverse transcriptase domain-containing protein [Tanacetum cinerariifolium]